MSLVLNVIKNPSQIPKKVSYLFNKYKPRRSNRSLATRIEMIKKRKLVRQARQLIKISITTPSPNTYEEESAGAISLHDLTYMLEDDNVLEKDTYDDSDDFDDLTSTESDDENHIPASTNLLSSSREDRAQSIDSLVSEEPEIVDI
jgi:hypothetical protein